MPEDKGFDIKEIIKQIEHNCGKDSIFSLDSDKDFKGKSISTGFTSIDEALSIGGIPCGKIMEVFGKESTGKSTLALQFMVQVQKKGKVIALIDAEHSFDFEYAQNLGLSKHNFLMSQPEHTEQALDIVINLITEENVGMVVIDSVAAMVPKVELEGEMEDKTMGVQAKLMSQGCRKILSSLRNKDCIVLFINQTRQKIGVIYGSPETTPGGFALKFFSSIRLKLSQCAKNTFPKIDGEIAGIKVKIDVVKNRMGKPFNTTEVDLLFGEGFSYNRDLFHSCVERNIIEKRGPYYAYKEHKEMGAEKFIKVTLNNEDLVNELMKEIETNNSNKNGDA